MLAQKKNLHVFWLLIYKKVFFLLNFRNDDIYQEKDFSSKINENEKYSHKRKKSQNLFHSIIFETLNIKFKLLIFIVFNTNFEF